MLTKDCEEIERLLIKCEELVETYQYDLAEKFCQKILTIDPNNIDAIQLQATILIDSGDVEGAKQVNFLLFSLYCTFFGYLDS